VKDGDQYRDSDKKRRELAELRNSAEALMYSSQRAVDECGEFVTPEILDEVRGDIAAVKSLLAEGDAIAIKDALQRLELSAYKIAEAMYGQG
jgi:molecular chaperone DnaK